MSTTATTTATTIPTITVEVKGHGTYVVPSSLVDLAMLRFLPASALQLQAKVTDAIGADYSDVVDVSALIVVLAACSAENHA
jgi:hypothetical protein